MRSSQNSTSITSYLSVSIVLLVAAGVVALWARDINSSIFGL